jgi:hypothetical protein
MTNSEHRRPPPEDGRQSLACRRDASVDNLTTLRDDPDLTFLLVEVDGTILHGWSSPVRLTSACSVMWSASYHLTEETSRFILSTGTALLTPDGIKGSAHAGAVDRRCLQTFQRGQLLRVGQVLIRAVLDMRSLVR